MRVLFLDIDGVLNAAKLANATPWARPVLTSNGGTGR